MRPLLLLALLTACTPTIGDDDDDAPTPLPPAEEAFTAPAEGVVLEGTLLLPEQAEDELAPGIVLVHGSGPHSRGVPLSGQLNMQFGFEFEAFTEIAIQLRNAGYAVYRYDKRSCGDWAGCDNDYPLPPEDLLADVFIDDAVAAMTALGAHPRVDADRLAVVGHSQGGGFVPHVLDVVGAAGVSVAGNWNTIDTLIAHQASSSRALLEQMGQSEEQIDAALADLDQGVADLAELRAGTWGGGPILGGPSAFWASWIALDLERPELVAAHAARIGALNGDYDWNVPASELDGWRDGGVETRELPCVSHALNCIEQPDWTRITEDDFGRHVHDSVHDGIEELLEAAGL